MLAEERREVVNKLVVRLITLNRKVAGAADDRLRCDGTRIEEANDRRVVAGGNVDERGAQTQTITKLTDGVAEKRCVQVIPKFCCL